MWVHQWHASHDKSFQAFPPLFILQVTKAGRGGLGMRLQTFPMHPPPNEAANAALNSLSPLRIHSGGYKFTQVAMNLAMDHTNPQVTQTGRVYIRATAVLRAAIDLPKSVNFGL